VCIVYRLKGVICFGEGAGANILARFAVRIIAAIDVCLHDCLYSSFPVYSTAELSLVNVFIVLISAIFSRKQIRF